MKAETRSIAVRLAGSASCGVGAWLAHVHGDLLLASLLAGGAVWCLAGAAFIFGLERWAIHRGLAPRDE